MTDKLKPKLNTKNPTPLQLLARRQNWEKLKLKGALSAIEISYQSYKGNTTAVDVRANLDLSIKFLSSALQSLYYLHDQQRAFLKDLKQSQQPTEPVPHSGEE